MSLIFLKKVVKLKK